MRLIFLFITSLACQGCFAQIIPMKDFRGYDADAYYKDINDELNTFEGTWSGDDGNYALSITLYKARNISTDDGGSTDLLYGSIDASLTNPNIPHQDNILPSFSLAAETHIVDNATLAPDEPAFFSFGLESNVPSEFVTHLSGSSVTWTNLTTEACFVKGEVIIQDRNVASEVCLRMSHLTENRVEKLLVYVDYGGPLYRDGSIWFVPPGFYVLTKQP